MKLHELKSDNALKERKRVGRGNGSGHGTYSGRGVKGQKSRSGYKHPASSLIGKLPKLRGYRFFKINKNIIQVVNLRNLEEKFKSGEIVNINSLSKNGLIDTGKILITKKVKILADGQLTKKLKFGDDIIFSKTASKIISQLKPQLKPKENKAKPKHA